MEQYAPRYGLHCTFYSYAPHLAEKCRIWVECEVSSYKTYSCNIPFDSFNFSSCKEGKVKRVLNIPDKFPVIECRSQQNLHCVVKHKRLRKKLGRFLTRCFKWKSYERIVLYDDSSPYSFFFEGYTKSGQGLCGGVILFGENDLDTAYYTLHT